MALYKVEASWYWRCGGESMTFLVEAGTKEDAERAALEAANKFSDERWGIDKSETQEIKLGEGAYCIDFDHWER